MTSPPDGVKRRPRNYERHILMLAVLTGLPGALVALGLLWAGDFSSRLQFTLSVVIVGSWIAMALVLRERVIRPLQTLSNLLAALLEGDYSIRSSRPTTDDALGLAMLEVNALGETLREQRLGALEATALLRTVVTEIDVAVFALDDEQRLRLINRAGEQLLGTTSERALGATATELGLQPLISGDDAPRILEAEFAGGSGRWELRRSTFRQGGVQHRLLVLADVSRALREEERQAWKRIVRVLGHEINNSLAPIKSIVASLRELLAREDRPTDFEEDLRRGLGVIGSRTHALGRFMAAYSRLARLPAPEREPVRVDDWVRRVSALETRLPVEVVPGPDITIQADGDQLEQLLINLVKNAADAALETGGAVMVEWSRSDSRLQVDVEDEGPGLAETSNLFVPFFTTKPEGTGIGLALSRQIAEAHGGTLTLENRPDARGARARLLLPV